MTTPVTPAIANARLGAGVSIDAAEDIFLMLAARARGLADAHLWRVDLDRTNRVLGCELIVSRGADTHVIHPRTVFRGAMAGVNGEGFELHEGRQAMPSKSTELR